MNKQDAKLPASLGIAIGEQLRETVAVDARLAGDNDRTQAVSQDHVSLAYPPSCGLRV